MKPVTKDEFFATVGQLNVHPTIEGNYDQKMGYRSDWKLPNGQVLGTSISGTVFMDAQYWIA
jgi:hypothetical protein